MNGFRNNMEKSAPPVSPSNSIEPDDDSKFDRMVTIKLSSISKFQVRDLKRKLQDELDRVRSCVNRIEAQTVMKKPKHYSLNKKPDFVQGKKKLAPTGSNSKSKPISGIKKADNTSKFDKGTNQIFKSCSDLLAKLMKHKFGWVFNSPVDVKGLGLHDYYTIVKTPMDLGTVKDRLSKKCYKSPLEFAEDVRLTFSNAMLYNPKGQDVHFMAEQLSKMFEEKWVSIEVQYNNLNKKANGFHDIDLPTQDSTRAHYSEPWPSSPVVENRMLERAESMTMPMDSKTVTVEKEVSDREMTYEEKRRLSEDLQDLPSEKLENIVQIIKKRNPGLAQEDDEIEIDIESVDPETLWELHGFVNDYKENLSRNKRESELCFQDDAESSHNVIQEMNTEAVVTEIRKNMESVGQKGDPVQQENPIQAQDGSDSSSSNSSSSDSGSDTSDSDSDNSSKRGSDAGNSPAAS